MRCPRCKCVEDKVVDSRASKDGSSVRRRRECLNCGHRFTTYEEVIQAELVVLKRDKLREDFDREKLRTGIYKACWKRPVTQEQIDALVNRIIKGVEQDFEREITAEEIGNRVMSELKGLDEVAYVRFASVYRRFRDIEEFINEIRQLNAGAANNVGNNGSGE